LEALRNAAHGIGDALLVASPRDAPPLASGDAAATARGGAGVVVGIGSSAAGALRLLK
jgi:hypothetical protein